MVETPEFGRRDDGLELRGAAMSAPEVEAWFVREVLPLEAMLMQYLRHNWRDPGEVEDLRQEVYIRVCQAAKKEIPHPAKAFVFTTARNLLIDRARKSNVVPIEAVSDLDALGIAVDAPGPDRSAMATHIQVFMACLHRCGRGSALRDGVRGSRQTGECCARRRGLA